jgi:hypothetical protein
MTLTEPNLPTVRASLDPRDEDEPPRWNFRLDYSAKLPVTVRAWLAEKAIDRIAGAKLDRRTLSIIEGVVTSAMRNLYEIGELYWSLEERWAWADDEDIREATELHRLLEGDSAPGDRHAIKVRLVEIERRRERRPPEMRGDPPTLT